MGSVLTLWLAGCFGAHETEPAAPLKAAEVRADGRPPGRGPSSPSGSGPDVYVPPAETAQNPAWAALLPTLTEATTRCAGAFSAPDLPAEVERGPLPWTAEELARACGDVRAAWEPARALLGQLRSVDPTIVHLARVADDLDYLERTRSTSGAERRNAVEHVKYALADLQADLGDDAGRTPTGYAAHYGPGREEEWRRHVETDGRLVAESRLVLENYAFAQELNPDQVRARMLTALGASADADLRGRQDGLTRAHAVGGASPAHDAYLAALAEWRAAYAGIVTTYTLRKVTTAELRAAQIARADEALARWRAAWDAEMKRLGAAPPPTP
jgi:hypothetical protein